MSWVQINSYLARPENMSAGFSLKQVCGIIAFPEISAFKILWSCSSHMPQLLSSWVAEVWISSVCFSKVTWQGLSPKKEKKFFPVLFHSLWKYTASWLTHWVTSSSVQFSKRHLTLQFYLLIICPVVVKCSFNQICCSIFLIHNISPLFSNCHVTKWYSIKALC